MVWEWRSNVVLGCLLIANMKSVAYMVPDLLDNYKGKLTWQNQSLFRNLMTEKNIKPKVMLYNGVYDPFTNYIGQRKWIQNINWAGQEGFKNVDRIVWKVNNNTAGFVHQYKTLTQVLIFGAGHLSNQIGKKN